MILKISPTGAAITKRFFFVIDVLVNQRKLRGMKTFTDLYNINYWNLSTLRKDQDKRMLKPEWLAYMVQDFNVNAEWLLTGVGSMFKTPNNDK